MAQTDARAGFRLPWNSERSNIEQTETDQVDGEQATEPAAAEHWPTTDEAPTATDEQLVEVAPEATDWGGNGHSDETASPAAIPPTHRKQTKFLADLTKAMQTAAEDARTRTLTQFQTEAKAYIEQIHGRSTTEAANLRRQADDDVASVREWSKAEIARIREETETRITARKGQLESEIERHAAMIEREVAQVQARVGEFENEMAAFFERLLGEEDPTHFATMAENLPEPPPFEAMGLGDWEPEPVVEAVADVVADEPTETPEAEAEMAVLTGEAETTEDATSETTTDETVGEVEVVEAVEGETSENGESREGHEGTGDGSGEGFEIDREAAFAAIQAAAEAAASAEVAADAADRAEAVADIALDIVGSRDHDAEGENDPRVDALGLTPDYDAAEAEAAATADTQPSPEGEEIPEINDDALAARLAGLVPGRGDKGSKSGDSKTTQVVVTGLVSVASIASFKRHLGRMAGVQSVGVSSGPDGEFLFAVAHSADVVLRDSIPGIPSFQARVTGAGDGTLNVTAHDPESDH